MPEDRRVDVLPLDVDAVPVLVIGTLLFAVALLAVVIAGGPAGWRTVCLCGVGLGLFTMPISRRMQRRGPDARR